jgi:hypothetical protein
MFARLYIPSGTNDIFRMLSKLQDGRILFQPGDWATCLYEEGQFDPDNPDKGLMRGHYILRVYL